VNHVFGGLGDWYHLRSLAAHPTILTLALQSVMHDTRHLRKIDRFVVEWPQAREQLLRLGVARERIKLIYPPVDTTKFSVAPAPHGRFTVLFASSPDRSDWLGARGVDLLLDAAALCPEIGFRLIWRPWGDSFPEVTRWIEHRRLRNVELYCGRIADMETCYAGVHATVAPFRDAERCKPAPNSIVESLACGRPVIVTRPVGLADVITEWNAGMIASDDASDLAAKLRMVQSSWPALSRNARALAEKCFAVDRFVDAYRQIYAEVL
jgi:glycosyltransferase involved in cell wall biosynthesis